MANLQILQSINNLNKHEQMIEFLNQDDGYWLRNNKWDMNEKFRYNLSMFRGKRYIDFAKVSNENIQLELKYFLLYGLKNKHFHIKYIINYFSAFLGKVAKYISIHNTNSFTEIQFDKFKLFILNDNLHVKTVGYYLKYFSPIMKFLIDFYDDREETEKDIWNCKKINGTKFPASGNRNGNFILDFTPIDEYYRDTVKKYLKTIITTRSFKHCERTLMILKYFFTTFQNKGYQNGFLENLSRGCIEDFIYQVENDYKEKNQTYKSQIVSFVKLFLDYIQLADYEKAPKKDTRLLISNSDYPRREQAMDVIKRVNFIPEPILKQLDNNIMDLDTPKNIPVYILLRETGWRGTDILNLRYNNCLEKIWNKKEDGYNYYLCGEITKTGIAELKIPIRDKVAEMVEKCIYIAKEESTDLNNPKRYLFNIYEGKHKGEPYQKQVITASIKRLIQEKDITDLSGGQLYHFKMHSLRHTRAKEYVEQGMGISVIQQILGHRSLQMTVHYATVTENTLYEKWKQTEDLDLFRVNLSTHSIEHVDTNSEDGENLVRYEYVKKNLDAVKVPFGVCFKPSKLPCKQQMNHCLTCASFCTTIDNIAEYEEEIEQVKKQIEISDRCGRELWAEKNKTYLKLLEELLERVKHHKLVHKNNASREDAVNG